MKYNYKDIKEEVRLIVAKIAGFSLLRYNDDTLIREELNIDSLMYLEIVGNIEKLYAIKLNEYKLIEIKTVKEFINYMIKVIKDKNGHFTHKSKR